MSNTKISAMTGAATLDGTEKIPGVQSSTNVALTPAQIATYMRTAAKLPPTEQVFTGSGTYTPTAGMTSCIIEVRAAGGGGGGVSNAVGYLAAGGGSEGGYSRGRYTAAQIGASQVVTIGAGGIAGDTSGGAGGTGGTTSVGALLQAIGGGAGQGATAAGIGGTTDAGIGSSGDINLQGAPGGFGFGITAATLVWGGAGGGAGGGRPRGGNNTGTAGVNGGGGGGGTSTNNTTAKAGGAGGPGYVIITEFFS